ncbi:hypothetical protein [Nostoc sp. MG11]|uniref:hypothetical protein n=1 Tax=Nostoc sp. MG11 TaxID=2721166 RepID=UPI00186845AA|nr:hypothetical protein [Nostoc sp. MG11]
MDILDQTSMDDILRLSTIRLLNAITSKHQKYIQKYSKLAYVQNKPFVICVAPFEQPFFFLQDSMAIVRVLYAHEQILTILGNEEGECIIVGESKSYKVQKNPNVDLLLGLFTNPSMSEVSAIIFNSKATFCKVRALAGNGKVPVIFYGDRLVKSKEELGRLRFMETRPNYKETLLDGLQILLNPFAKHPLDIKIFENKEIAVHDYDPQEQSHVPKLPNGFLLQRICQSITSEDTVLEFKQFIGNKLYQKLPVLTWAEDELIYVGGQNGPSRDNHMAHYRGWTAVVFFDSIDEDWGTLAVDSLCHNIPQFMKANADDSILSTGVAEWFATKEKAYAAIKSKIDQSYYQNNNI